VVRAQGAAGLADALAEAARGLPSSVTVTADLPSNLPASEAATLEVSVSTGSRTALLRVDVPAAAGAEAVAAQPTPLSAADAAGAAATAAMDAATVRVHEPALPLWAVGLAIFVLLAVAVLMLWPRAQSSTERRRRALDAYTLIGSQASSGSFAPGGAGGAPGMPDDASTDGSRLSTGAGSLLRVSQRYVASRGREARIALALDRAGLAMKPSEWVVLRCCAAVAAAAVFGLLSRHMLFGGAVGVLAAWGISAFWLRHRQDQRSAAFADQLPDTLQVVASSLRSGFSLNQALSAANERGLEPMASELGRALAATRIGAPLEDELEAVATRMNSEDWRWAVMAIRIQRNVGGNLAEILLTTAHTLRERAAMGRQVRALSAEGRLSAYILIALPIFAGGFMLVSRRSYIEPLWTTVPGLVMLVGAVGGVAIGWVWMRKVIEVRV
jgi:tight adherence protein B